MANEVATQRQLTPEQKKVRDFKTNLGRMVEANELPLPSSVPVETFRNAAIVAVQENPDILNCSPASVFRGIRKLAAMGLIPDGREAAIVRFKGEAQAMPMVWGLVKIARQSGRIETIRAEVVREGEKLVRSEVLGNEEWRHVRDDGSPIDFMDREGEIRGVYAIATLKGGGVEVEPMSRQEIEKRRMASPQQRGSRTPAGIWAGWYDEMAKKTVLRSLLKKLPMSAEDRARVEAEEPYESARDVTPPANAFASRALAAREAEPEDETPHDEDGVVVEEAEPEREQLAKAPPDVEDAEEVEETSH